MSPTPASATGFSITVPATWYELDLDPATRRDSIRSLVESRTRGTDLWPQRRALMKVLEEQASSAASAGALYCASFSTPTSVGPVTGSVMVSLVGDPMPDVEGSLGAIARGFTEHPRTDDELAPWATTSVVDIEGCGTCPRSSGIEDTRLADGRFLRHVFMLTAVPVPESGQAFLVAASSPVLPLADALLDLFDAVTGTFRVVRASDVTP